MTSCRTGLRRVIEIAVLPALLLALVLLPALAADLPDPITTHWGFDGAPDGSSGRTLFTIAVAAAWLLAWALLALLARSPHARAGARLHEAVPILAAGGFIAGLTLATVAANDGAASWREAGELGAGAVIAPLLGGALAGGIAYALERGRPAAPRAAAPTAPATANLAPGERAVWVGRASSPATAAAFAVGAVALAALGVLTGNGWGVAVGATLVPAAVWFSSVRVTASHAGVRVAYGPAGPAAKHVPLDQIERAEAAEIEPRKWGGWGYRWAGRGRSAVVLRRGPGLVLRLRDGRVFGVTVDSPDAAAGLLNDLVMRHHPQRS
jgi:hypothetical protein